jgi:hypothetical protein
VSDLSVRSNHRWIRENHHEVAKSREDLGCRIWGIYEGSIVVRYGEVARQISPRVIQLSKTVKESWPSIKDSRGPLDQDDTWQKIRAPQRLHFEVSHVVKFKGKRFKLAICEFMKGFEPLDHQELWTIDQA